MVAWAGIDAAAVLPYDVDVGTLVGLVVGNLAPIESARMCPTDVAAFAAATSPFDVSAFLERLLTMASPDLCIEFVLGASILVLLVFLTDKSHELLLEISEFSFDEAQQLVQRCIGGLAECVSRLGDNEFRLTFE